MKNVRIFQDFLKDTVNLNDTRLHSLEDTSAALESFVRNSAWCDDELEWYPQGSWAHKTIIKPLAGREYDADILAIVPPVWGWEPSDYINELYAVFRGSDRYREKVRRWEHCVTVSYAGDKAIDIAPCVENRGGYNTLEVCSRTDNAYIQTQPKEYTDWLIAVNSVSRNNTFRKVTRLFKYLRDIKRTFSVSSVSLTTLLANQVYEEDRYQGEFVDVPTSLRTVFERLDTWLQIRPLVPRVDNPFGNENFAEGWTQEEYDNFRSQIHKYRGWVDDAYNEEDRNQSISKWRRVFGAEFGKEEALIEAASTTNKVAEHVSNARLNLPAAATDVVTDIIDFVKALGRRAIPPNFASLPYQEQPSWPVVAHGMTVRIAAKLHRSRSTAAIADVESAQIVSKNMDILFSLRTMTGGPFPTSDYKVHWRVTNTGDEAIDVGELRGSIIAPNSGNDRWETLRYRGVHVVEAFAVRKRDLVGVARSEPFFVAIE